MSLSDLFLSLMFESKNFGACLHLLTNSSLLLITSPSFCIINSFSLRHKLHFLLPALYGTLFFKIENEISLCRSNSWPASFSHQNSCESFVLSLYLRWLKDVIWSDHLPLNSGSDTPIYRLRIFALGTLMFPLYTDAFVKHSPFKGHLSGLLQLHVLSGWPVERNFTRVFMLWLEM